MVRYKELCVCVSVCVCVCVCVHMTIVVVGSYGEKWGEPISDFLMGNWDLRGHVLGLCFEIFF